MITGKDINPRKKIYYLGGVIIEILKKHTEQNMAFFDIFHIVNEKEKISVNLFTLTLDWLFLLGVIDHNKGEIKKCF